MRYTQPTAEEQLAFLHDLQRIFAEGDCSATYKFALVMALAEIAVEAGNDSGESETISLRTLGEKFVELYWRQVAPYSTESGSSGVLAQNRGRQAEVVGHVRALHEASRGNLPAARRSAEWESRVRTIAKTVRDMPVRHLQVIAGAQRKFLYEYPLIRDDAIDLKPGVMFCLRRFQGFIQQMARSAWVEHVRLNAQNTSILGNADDLAGFMFGTPRADRWPSC